MSHCHSNQMMQGRNGLPMGNLLSESHTTRWRMDQRLWTALAEFGFWQCHREWRCLGGSCCTIRFSLSTIWWKGVGHWWTDAACANHNPNQLYRVITAVFNFSLAQLSRGGTTDAISAIHNNSDYTKREKSILLITQFILWRGRCSRAFRGIEKNNTTLTEEISTQWNYMSAARWTALPPIYFFC